MKEYPFAAPYVMNQGVHRAKYSREFFLCYINIMMNSFTPAKAFTAPVDNRRRAVALV